MGIWESAKGWNEWNDENESFLLPGLARLYKTCWLVVSLLFHFHHCSFYLWLWHWQTTTKTSCDAGLPWTLDQTSCRHLALDATPGQWFEDVEIEWSHESSQCMAQLSQISQCFNMNNIHRNHSWVTAIGSWVVSSMLWTAPLAAGVGRLLWRCTVFFFFDDFDVANWKITILRYFNVF